MTPGAALAACAAVFLCLVPRSRLALLGGLALLAAAEAVLARSLVPAHVLQQLYVVLAAAALALIVRIVRGEQRALPFVLGVPLAAYVGLASVSYLWTEDRPAAGLELVFFLLPFALLVAVVGRSRREPWLPKALAATMVALGGLFAVIGIWQSFTHTLFFAPTLEVANAYTTFFRVTSLFKDPSLYGRELVLAISVLLVLTLGRRLPLAWGFAGITLLWVGLYPSYSQSSMVALIVVAAGFAAWLGDH